MRQNGFILSVRGGCALAVLLGALVLACGSDEKGPTTSDPEDPPVDPTSFDVPADGTLAEVVAMASAGDTIRVTGTDNAVPASVTVGATLDSLVIIGRSSARGGAYAALTGSVGSSPLLIVEPQANGVEIRGLEIVGSFGTGIRVAGQGVVVDDCWISDALFYGVAFVGSGGGVVSRSVLEGAGSFGVQCNTGTSPELRENTVVGAGDCGIYSVNATPSVERNIIYGSAQWGVACFPPSLPTLSCNVMYLNVNGNTSGCAPGSDDMDADPLFCGDGSYAVEPGSPAEGGTCGWVGAVQALCPTRGDAGRRADADR